MNLVINSNFGGNVMKTFHFWTCVATVAVSCMVTACSTPMKPAREMTDHEIERAWKTGHTLDESIFEKYQLPQYGKAKNDNGINVLFDDAHEVSFAIHWGLSNQIREGGFRSANTHATFDEVLTPGNLVRVRADLGNKINPFAWWRIPEFNVVVLHQGDPSAPRYLREEIDALKRFVNDGGGVVFLNRQPRNEETLATWSYNDVFKAFGASMTTVRAKTPDGKQVPGVAIGEGWEVLKKDGTGNVYRARRTFGKGRVLVVEGNEAAVPPKNMARDDARKLKQEFYDLLTWTAGGKPAVGGDHVMPSPRGGGGGIYPSLEARADGLVCYYAKNQTKELLDAVKEDIPLTGKKVLEWLPTVMPEEPVYFILAAGGGGGWAVNAFLPKETGVICLDKLGVIGVYAHEIGHTMPGPRNTKGEIAGRDGINQGEAHAGWLQGKATAYFSAKDRERSNRNCNSIMKKESFLKLDLSGPETDPKYGKNWEKLWWVWQKLDDTYGTTWFPRWYWVRSMRYMDKPDHRLSFEETVECMSIAVGEDLFPFFRKLGTTLSKERFPEADFNGEKLTLPEAKIDLSPAGNVRLEPVGDYTKPLKKR